MGSRGASIPMGDGYDGYGFRRPSHRQAGDPTRGLAYVTAPGLCCWRVVVIVVVQGMKKGGSTLFSCKVGGGRARVVGSTGGARGRREGGG